MASGLRASVCGEQLPERWNGIINWNTGMTFYPKNLTFGGLL